MSNFRETDLINFGELPPAVNESLQQGVALYRHDKRAAQALFESLLAQRPGVLATYFCLYKIHTYHGQLREALRFAHDGLAQACVQAGLSPDWTTWTPSDISHGPAMPTRFALYTLKALAFIHLKLGDRSACQALLAKLDALELSEGVGGGVVAELERAIP